jgi:hypothetical protein
MKVEFEVFSSLRTSAKKMLKRVPTQNVNPVSKTMPLVAMPLVLYDIYNANTKKLFDALDRNDIKVPKNISVSPISNSGLDEASKSKVRREIQNAFRDKKIDERTKNDLMAKVNFTGKTDELADSVNIDTDFNTDLVDISSSEGFQEIVDTPDTGIIEDDGLTGLFEGVTETIEDGGNIIDVIKVILENIG